MEYQDNTAIEFIQAKASEAGIALTRELVLQESKFFLTKDISDAAGIFQMLRRSDTVRDGVLNINSAEIPKDEHLVLKGIQLKGAFNSDGAITNAIYKHTTNQAPGALLNGTLRIKVGGNTIFQEKIEDFFLETASDKIGADIFYPLKNFKYVLGGEQIEVEIVLPEGEKLEPDLNKKHFLKVKFVGTAAVLKS